MRIKRNQLNNEACRLCRLADLKPFHLAGKEAHTGQGRLKEPREGRQAAHKTIRRQTCPVSVIPAGCTQLYGVTGSVLPLLSLHGLHCLPSHWVQSDSFGMEGLYLLPPPFPLHSFPTDPGDRPVLECNLLSPSTFIPTRPQK